jgi:hypothetical protein
VHAAHFPLGFVLMFFFFFLPTKIIAFKTCRNNNETFRNCTVWMRFRGDTAVSLTWDNRRFVLRTQMRYTDTNLTKRTNSSKYFSRYEYDNNNNDSVSGRYSHFPFRIRSPIAVADQPMAVAQPAVGFGGRALLPPPGKFSEIFTNST